MFESLEPRLALATLDITGTSLTLTLADGETSLVGGDSLDGSVGNPLHFQSDNYWIIGSGDAASYFDGVSNSSTATLKSGQTLDFLTSIEIVNGSGSSAYFTVGDGTHTLPDFGAAISLNFHGHARYLCQRCDHHGLWSNVRLRRDDQRRRDPHGHQHQFQWHAQRQ